MRSVSIAQLDAEERAGIYSFLARVLSTRPTLDSVWGLCQMAEAFGFGRLAHLPLEELDREYQELFVIPNPRYVAPYESVVRQGRGSVDTVPDVRAGSQASHKLIFCELAQEVGEYCREAGLKTGQESPDHIGSELKVMAYLLWRQAHSSESEASRLASVRSEFRQKHLLQWIGTAREMVAERDKLGYYHNAYRLVEAVIEEDQE